MRENEKQLKMGAILSYVSVALHLVMGLVFTPWMVGKLGSGQYGLYTLANSVISMFLVDFGLSSAVGRYVAEYHTKGEEDRVARFLGAVYKLYLLIDALIFAILITVFFLIDRIYVKLTPWELEHFKVVYLIASSFSVVSFPFVTLNGILTAYEKFIPLKMADVVQKLLQVCIVAVALNAGYGLYALVSINAAVGLIIILFKLWVIRKTTTAKVDAKHTDTGIYKEIFGFSMWTTVATLAQRLVFNIAPSVLGIVSNSAEIAVFGVVTTIEGNLYTLTNAVNGMFLPRITRIFTQEEDPEKSLEKLMLPVGKYQFGLTGLVIAGFVLLGREFIYLWVGDLYADAYWGILLVIIPGMFYSALQIANTAVVVKKQVRIPAFVNLAVGITSVVLSFPLSKRFGALGASAAICIAYCIRAVLLNVVYSKVLHLKMGRFVRECYIRMSVPILLTILVSNGILTGIQGTGWGWLACKAVLISMIYGAILLTIGVENGWRNIRKLI